MNARRLLPCLVLAGAVAAVAVSGVRLERMGERGSAEELLYLPNGKHLEVMSLGHASLLADFVYLWAIQYYSNYEREDRHRYVEHVFQDVITELDPRYIDAYWLGALILVLEADDLEAGLRLLDKGIAANPDSWILPYLAGWECYYAGRFEEAARYFDLAAAVPHAPPRVIRMRAGVISKTGRVEEAIAMWREVLEDPRSDAASIAIAERQLRTLETRYALRRLEEAIEEFRADNDRLPRDLDELRTRSYIRHLPRDSEGRSFRYDPRTGRVVPPRDRVLGDSS